MKEYQAKKDRYSKIQYRKVGKSGIHLSELSLGLWHNFGAEDDFDTCKSVLHTAFDKGIVSFDLANNYGPPNGSAEETFGKIMAQSFHKYRSEIFVATKAGHQMWDGPFGDWGSRKSLMNSLDQSLKRMQLDYVDVFYTHRYDPNTPLEETMQTLVDIVKRGKALYVGISKYPPEVAQLAYQYLRDRDVPCLLYQAKYNLLHREPEKEILTQARDNGVGFIAFTPLAQGLLTDKYLSGKIEPNSRMAIGHFLKGDILTPMLVEKLNQLNEIAQQREQSLAEMSLSWLLKDSLVSSVIVGVRNVEQLNKNIKALENTVFSISELEQIDNICCIQ